MKAIQGREIQVSETLTEQLLEVFAEVGSSFFRSVTGWLTHTLRVKYAAVLIPGKTNVYAPAVCTEGGLPEEVTYPAAFCTHSGFAEHESFFIPLHAGAYFPEIVGWSPESGQCIALRGAQGEKAGLLCLLHDQPAPLPFIPETRIWQQLCHRLAGEIVQHQHLKKYQRDALCFNHLLDADVMGIIISNEQGEVTFANRYFLNMLGYSEEDLERGEISWLDMTPPRYRTADEKAVINLLTTGRSLPYEKAYFSKEGVEVPIWVSGIRLGEKEAIAVILDIAEQKNAQKQIIQSEARLRRLVDSNMVGIIIWNYEGNILEANDYMLNLLGYSRQELEQGKMIWPEMTPPDHQATDQKAIAELVAYGICDAFEKEYFHKDGSRVPVWIRGVMLEDEKGVGLAIILDISGRKRAEQMAHASETRFRALAESGIVGVVSGNLDTGKLNYVNQYVLDMLGYSSSDDLNWLLMSAPETADRDQKAVDEVLRDRRCQPYEKNCIHADGHRIPVWVGGVSMVKDSREVIACVIDISEQKKAEEKLRRSEQFYRSIAENFPNGYICILDKNYNTVLLEGTELQRIGFASSDFVNKNFLEYSSPDGLNLLLPHYRRAFEGQSISFTYFFRAINSYYNVNVAPVHNEKGEIDNIVIVIQNINQIIQAETKLRQSEIRLKEAQQIAKMGNWEFDLATRQFNGSEEVLHICGIEAFGEENFDFDRIAGRLAPADIQLLREVVKKATRTATICQTDISITLPEGRKVHLNVIAKPDLNEDNRVVRLRGIVTDITDRKETAEALRIAKEKAEEAYRVRSNFLANMTHEIRTPLNGIIGLAQVIRDEAKEPEIIEYVNLIQESGKRLLDTINHILDFSKLEAKGIELNLKPHPVTRVCENIVRSLRVLAQQKKLDLSLECGDRELQVYIDEIHMSQVLNNLIGNAIKFTEKGHIRVIVDKASPDEVSIKISDTGIGISKEYIERIFAPFTQASSGYGRKYGGTGLGLAIAKNIIELMHGSIQVESTPGQGSIFEVRLPLAGETPS